MVNNSTNINHTNNYLSPKFIEHKQKIRTHDVGNPSTVLRQHYIMPKLNQLMGS